MMETHNLIPQIKKRVARKSSIKTEKILLPSKTKRFSQSIGNNLVKIYAPKSIEFSKILANRPKYKKKINCIIQDTSTCEDIRLPPVSTSFSPNNHLAMKLIEKEEKLNDLIEDFIVTRQPKPRYTKIRRNLIKSVETSYRENEGKIYEDSLQEHGEKDLSQHRNNIENNLNIEKFRLKNRKKLKEKLRIV